MPGPLVFNPAPEGSRQLTPQSLTIYNQGTAPLLFTGTGIALTGANPADFSIVGVVVTDPLAPGANRSLQIAFYPQGIGIRTAYVQFTTNDPSQPTLKITLTGQGTGKNAVGAWTQYE